jgi:O-glycosyl hydrolase
MRARILIVAVLVAVLAVAGARAKGQARQTLAETTNVTVDLAATRQVIQGFGSSNRVWIDPHVANNGAFVPPAAQAKILTALYGRLGLTRVRDVLDQGVQEAPGSPFQFGGRMADGHIAFVKQAKRYGLKTFFPGPVYVEPWMKADNPSAYVNWAMAMLSRWRSQGLEPPLYAPLNEPMINGDFPPQWFHDVVLQLGKRLRAAGFKTMLVIPDDENPTAAYPRAVAVLQDPSARKYVAALAYHVYRWDRADMVRMRELGTRYKLPVWMTEYSNDAYRDWGSSFEWAERTHVLLTDGGVGAIDYMWGYFGSWSRSDTYVSIDFTDGAYRGFSATPLFWLTGQYSRYVRPGYRRVEASPASGDVLTSAYTGPKRAIVVATNPSTSATRSIRVTVRGGRLKGVIRPVRSSASEQWKSLPPITPRNGSFTATLPPQSITTFVATR